MPPVALFDVSKIDLDRVLHNIEDIRLTNPQRGDMEHVNAICYADDKGQVAGFKDVRPDEFWVPGHIPGRPLLPGVIMIEAAAQVSGFYTKRYLKWPGFIGFGAVEGFKFRGEVPPGVRLHILSRVTWSRHRRVASDVQGYVKGTLVFEGTIVGVQMSE